MLCITQPFMYSLYLPVAEKMIGTVVISHQECRAKNAFVNNSEEILIRDSGVMKKSTLWLNKKDMMR